MENAIRVCPYFSRMDSSFIIHDEIEELEAEKMNQ